MYKENKKIIKSNKGFTFIEVLVVIVIIAILAVAGFYSGRGHIKISMTTEARSLIERIVAQEKMYLIRNSGFYVTEDNEKIDSCKELKIDSSQNKYFKLFSINTGISAVSGSAADSTYMLTIKAFANEDYEELSDVSVVGVYNLGTGKIEYEENL